LIKEYLSLVLSLIALLLLINTNSLGDISAQLNNIPLQSNISQNSPNSPMGQEINLSKIATDVKNPQTGETEALSIKDPQTGETEFIASSEIELNNSNDSLRAGEVDSDDTGLELGDNINNNRLIENLLDVNRALDLNVNSRDEITRENLKELLAESVNNKLVSNEIAGNVETVEDLSIAKNLQEREFNLFKSCIIDPNSNGFSRSANYEIRGKASMWNPEMKNYTVSKDTYVGLNSRGDKVTGDIRSGDFNPMIEINRIVTNCYSEKDFRSNSIPLIKTIPIKSHSLNPPTNSCPEGFNIGYNIHGTINNLKNTITIDNPSDMYFSLSMRSDFVNGNLESYIQVGPLYGSYKINNIYTTCTIEN
jgi:hypothetical protein